MSYDDDELDLPSVSEEKRITHADHGKRDALRQQIHEEQGKNVSDQQAELKMDVSLKQLKNDIAGKSDEETKRKEKQEDANVTKTFGTKTKKQMEEDSVLTAKSKETPEDKIAKEQVKQDLQDETEEEYQQQMG